MGQVTKTAAVTTNDPSQSSITLSMIASFKMDGASGPFAVSPADQSAGKRIGPFSVSPSDRWVTETFTGEMTNGMVTLINQTKTPVHIKKVVSGGNEFTVNLQTLEDGKQYRLMFGLGSGLKIGKHTQTVKVLTDSKELPELPIELDVTVRSHVFATPTSFNLPGLSLESSGPMLNLGTIYVRKIGQAGLKIDSVTSTLPFLISEVVTHTEGQLYAIRVTVDKAKIKSSQPFHGAIRVKTNDAETPVLEIPVQGSFSS